MSNSNLEELAKQERRTYFKEWRAKNKDKVRQSNQRYWLNKAKKSKNNKREETADE